MKRGFSGVGEDFYEGVSALYSQAVEEIPLDQYTYTNGQPLVSGVVTGPLGSVNLAIMPNWGWVAIGVLVLLAMRR